MLARGLGFRELGLPTEGTLVLPPILATSLKFLIRRTQVRLTPTPRALNPKPGLVGSRAYLGLGRKNPSPVPCAPQACHGFVLEFDLLSSTRSLRYHPSGLGIYAQLLPVMKSAGTSCNPAHPVASIMSRVR